MLTSGRQSMLQVAWPPGKLVTPGTARLMVLPDRDSVTPGKLVLLVLRMLVQSENASLVRVMVGGNTVESASIVQLIP